MLKPTSGIIGRLKALFDAILERIKLFFGKAVRFTNLYDSCRPARVQKPSRGGNMGISQNHEFERDITHKEFKECLENQ